MPTKSVAVSTTEVKVAEYNKDRTIIIFSNPDTAEPIYVSDSQGVGTNGIVVAPEMTVILTRLDGWDTTVAHYAYCALVKTLNIGEGLQPLVTGGNSGGGNGGIPNPHDPPM